MENLEVKVSLIPSEIKINYEEIKKELTEYVDDFGKIAVTEDSIQAAKKDRANLNKIKDSIKKKRTEFKKECLKPFEEVDVQLKDLESIVDNTVNTIDAQIKDFEQMLKDEKKKKIDAFLVDANRTITEEGLEIPFDEKWLNATVSMKKVKEEILSLRDEINTNFTLLKGLSDFSFEAIEYYKSGLDIKAVMSKVNDLLEMKKKKEEAEKIAALKAAEEKSTTPDLTLPKTEIPPLVTNTSLKANEAVISAKTSAEPMRKWFNLQVYCSREEAKAFSDFLVNNSINYKVL